MTAPRATGQGGEATFVVDVGTYNGPLDLLLSLIRDEKIDIYDIPIARICEQFLARMHDLALNDAAEYLEMAARLVRIKAMMLLPRHEGDEQWEDPRAELVRRLLEYQQMREVVDVLDAGSTLAEGSALVPVVPVPGVNALASNTTSSPPVSSAGSYTGDTDAKNAASANNRMPKNAPAPLATPL